jgi:hypothetical protein
MLHIVSRTGGPEKNKKQDRFGVLIYGIFRYLKKINLMVFLQKYLQNKIRNYE